MTLPVYPALPSPAFIANRLGLAEDALDFGILTLEYAFVAAQMLVAWPPPVGFEFAGTDVTFFARACNLAVAARLFGPLTTGTGGILVKQKSAAGSEDTYAPPPAASPEKWLTEAKDAMQYVSYIRAALAVTAAGFSLFSVGRTLQERAYGVPAGTIDTALFSYLLDYTRYPLLGSTYAGGSYGYE